MLAIFERAGLDWNGGDEGHEILLALSASYEPLLHSLAEYLRTSLPPWVTPRDTPDHWERGVRGVLARRLIGGLADGSITPASEKNGSGRKGWRRRVREPIPPGS